MAPRSGFSTVTPYLVCKRASEAIAFYTRHFGAKELYRLPDGSGKIAHAEITIGNSRLMIADEMRDFGILSPESLGGSPVSLAVYVDDVDVTFKEMVSAGSIVLSDVADQFHGDRSGKLVDPFGHIWHVGTNVEEVSSSEVLRRYASLVNG